MEKVLKKNLRKKSLRIGKRILPIGDTWKIFVKKYSSNNKKRKEKALILVPQIKIQYKNKTRKNIKVAIKQCRNILENITKFSNQQVHLQKESRELIKNLTDQLIDIRRDISSQSDQVDKNLISFQTVLKKIEKFTVAANELIQKFVKIIKTLRKPKTSLEIITSLELIANALQNIAQMTIELTKPDNPSNQTVD